MPNWSDENGRYWWNWPGLIEVEIPHPPIQVVKNCKCQFCRYDKIEKLYKKYKEARNGIRSEMVGR
jgi:hypothetical protein